MLTNESMLDLFGVCEVGCSLYIKINNDLEKELKYENDEFETQLIFFSEVNEVYLRAVDLAGNEKKDSVLVTYDTIVPELIVYTGDSIVYIGKYVIEGSSHDKNGVKNIFINDVSLFEMNDSFFSREVILESGNNNIEIVTYDNAGNYNTSVIKVQYISGTGPEIEITLPKENSYVGGDTIRLIGHTSADTLFINNQKVDLKLFEYYNIDSVLDISDTTQYKEGYNTVVIRGISQALGEREKIYPFIIDKTSPEITILYPEDTNYITSKSPIKIIGRVNEEDVTLKIEDSISEHVAVIKNGEFSTDILLSSGENEILLVAEDKAGNKRSEVVKVIYDIELPNLEIIEPVDLLNTYDLSVKVSGTTDTDCRVFVFVEYQGSVYGDYKQVPVNTYDGSFMTYTTIPENKSNIVIQSIDQAENKAVEYRRIYGLFGTPGTLTIESIQGYSTVSTGSENNPVIMNVKNYGNATVFINEDSVGLKIVNTVTQEECTNEFTYIRLDNTPYVASNQTVELRFYLNIPDSIQIEQIKLDGFISGIDAFNDAEVNCTFAVEPLYQSIEKNAEIEVVGNEIANEVFKNGETYPIKITISNKGTADVIIQKTNILFYRDEIDVTDSEFIYVKTDDITKIFGENSAEFKFEFLPKQLTSSGEIIVKYNFEGIDENNSNNILKLNEYEIGKFRIQHGTQFIKDVVPMPNPYNPLTGNPLKLKYELGQDSKVDIIIYTLTGKRVLKRSFEKGRAGGKMGVNYFLWYGENGKNRTVANGGYLIKIKVNDYKGGSKEIYKKIAVLKF